MRWRWCGIWMCYLLAGGCGSSPRAAQQPVGPNADVRVGYALLREVVAEETQVADLFLLRSAAQTTKTIVREIASMSRDAQQELSRLGLPSNAAELPVAEVGARRILAGWETKRLLMGGELDRDLLINQVEATQYIAALAGYLAEHDEDADRAGRMKALSGKMLELNERCRRRLEAVAVEE